MVLEDLPTRVIMMMTMMVVVVVVVVVSVALRPILAINQGKGNTSDPVVQTNKQT